MTSRLQQLRAAFAANNIDAFLVQKDVNIQYLTGFPARESWLLVCQRQAFYLTDFRYREEARKGLKGVVVRQYAQSIVEECFKMIQAQRCRRIGFEARHVTLAQYRLLEKNRPQGIQWAKTDHLVERFREVKSADEIQKIQQALGLHKQAHQFLKRILKPHLTEKEVLLKLERFVKSRDAGFSFDPIIAAGVNSSYPHAKVTARTIPNHHIVLIDMGVDVKGYKSDLTRIFFLGKIPPLIRDIYTHVQAAQRRAIENIKPGVPAADVDRAARHYLEEKHLAKYFGHALGHGVGLEIHEQPRLSQNDPAILRPGMVITVEPAVYVPGQFGIRCEDMVLVTPKGCRILSDDFH